MYDQNGDVTEADFAQTDTEVAGSGQEYTNFHDEYSVLEESQPFMEGNNELKQSKYSDDEMLRAMYAELQLISAQLKTKNMELTQKELLLDEREVRLSIREEELETAYKKLAVNLHKAVDEQCAVKSKKSKEKVSEFQDMVKEKTKENRRLRANFDALQEANSQLRKQCDDLHNRNLKLEKQSNSLKQRMENLQRCQELKDRQTENIIAEMKSAPSKSKPKQVKVTKSSSYSSVLQGSSSDVFVVLIEWTIKDVLKPSFDRGKSLDGFLRAHILDNCQKMLPSLVDLVRDPNNQSQTKVCLPCLQFIYWSCLLLDQHPGKQNVGLGACQRRLAEELYRPIKPDENEALPSNLFVKSADVQIKLLSCLLLLKTLTQVDCIANVFSLLKHELRDELVKELFVHYNGPSVLLAYFKPTCKVQLPMVLDIYMLMCVESTALQPFLASCGTEAWFRFVAMVLKIPSLDVKQLEKISVILQKLSKVRDNRRHFETFGLKKAVQDLMHNASTTDHSFLVLNFKSVLFNITSCATD